jgi:hypothetical protein
LSQSKVPLAKLTVANQLKNVPSVWNSEDQQFGV